MKRLWEADLKKPLFKPYYSAEQNKGFTMPDSRTISELAKEIARQAQEKAYTAAVHDLIDAVCRFGACGCPVDHDDTCVWSKGMKEMKAWAQQALQAAQLLERLK